jgi:hypothetical protein
MGNVAILLLRVVIALAFAGSLVVQAVIVPLLWLDLDEAPTRVGSPSWPSWSWAS